MTLGQSDSKVNLTLREFTGALDRGLPLLVLTFTEEPLGVLGSPDTYLGGQGNSSQHLTFHSHVQVWHQTLQRLNVSLSLRRSQEGVDPLNSLEPGRWELALFSHLLRLGKGFPSRQAAACKEILTV